MKKHLLVTLAALGAAFAIAPAGLAANGDNSENAKLCQKSGWQSLYTPAGSPFADQGTCVSYGAQGGTLTTQPKTKSQLDFLVREACDLVQGYVVGRPLPIEEYGDLVGRPPAEPKRLVLVK